VDKLAAEKSILWDDVDPPQQVRVRDATGQDGTENSQLAWLDYDLTRHLSRNSVVIVDGIDKLREKAARHLLWQLLYGGEGGQQLLIFRVAVVKNKIAGQDLPPILGEDI
jgi:hypothetical protein